MIVLRQKEFVSLKTKIKAKLENKKRKKFGIDRNRERKLRMMGISDRKREFVEDRVGKPEVRSLDLPFMERYNRFNSKEGAHMANAMEYSNNTPWSELKANKDKIDNEYIRRRLEERGLKVKKETFFI